MSAVQKQIFKTGKKKKPRFCVVSSEYLSTPVGILYENGSCLFYTQSLQSFSPQEISHFFFFLALPMVF